MKVICGLGNPGERYRFTRHNVGFRVVDLLADRWGLTGEGRVRDGAATLEARRPEDRVLLVKPMRYMNRSGPPLGGAIRQTDVDASSDLLIVADDIDLPLGKIRLRRSGSAGGHNGLRSIIEELGTEKFSRLRVGIGDPVRNARDHVLSKFEPDEVQRLDELLDAAADAVEAWARDGTSKAANRFNTFQLREADATRLAAPGEVDGPPDASGVRRTRTGWRRVLPGKHGEEQERGQDA
jgi:PTH1 family peptidyl-tRNA hydrolase